MATFSDINGELSFGLSDATLSRLELVCIPEPREGICEFIANAKVFTLDGEYLTARQIRDSVPNENPLYLRLWYERIYMLEKAKAAFAQDFLDRWAGHAGAALNADMSVRHE